MSRLHYYLMLLIMIIFPSANSFADVDASAIQIQWGYIGSRGPEFWGQLSKQFALCSQGKMQSPINIPKLTHLVRKESELTIHYDAAPLEIMDDGPTELMIGAHHTIANTGHGIQLNFHPDKVKEVVTYAERDYHLRQFHFHSPSENQLEGRSYPLEIHFVHQGEDGRVLVIGVFVLAGKVNHALEKIIQHFPKHDGKPHIIKREKINPSRFIPAQQDYYEFSGSLTTPPCVEGLRWVVMKEPIFASPAQIVKIRRAIGGSNARSVQPLNNRLISYVLERE